jgi:hypothetical protein
MRTPNSNCRGAPSAKVPDWKLARNGVRLDPGATPPRTFGARYGPNDAGAKEELAMLPGKNAFQKLKRLYTLALGSMVTRS